MTLSAIALPASASGQAALSHTWVSANGSNTADCSRATPCRTFERAMNHTTQNGRISCLDPGEFGALTINRSLTIKCQHTEGGVFVSANNGIVINAAATDRVTIRGLDIDGFGTAANGIGIVQARSVRVLDTEISHFTRNGVAVVPTSLTRVTVDDSHIHDNAGNGVLVAPPNGSAARVAVRGNKIDDNGCAIAAAQFGRDPALDFATRCGTNPPNGALGVARINAFDNRIADSGHNSVLSNGGASTVRIGGNAITGSIGTALQSLSGGAILSYGDNRVTGNPGGDGAPNGTIAPLKTQAR